MLKIQQNSSKPEFKFILPSGVQNETIEAIRNTRIVTIIEINDDGRIKMSTSNADTDDEPNAVTFQPGIPSNITNPLNGEDVEVYATMQLPNKI